MVLALCIQWLAICLWCVDAIPGTVCGLLSALAALAAGARRDRWLWLVAAAVSASILMPMAMRAQAAGGVSRDLVEREIVAVVRVETVAHRTAHAWRARVSTESAVLPARFLLDWAREPAAQIGHCVQVRLRFVAPRPVALAQRVARMRRGEGERAVVTGVLGVVDCLRRPAPTDALRRIIADVILEAVAPGEGRAALFAILLGDRGGLSATSRDALQRTGTAHLAAISGLHVGLAATFGYWLLRGLPVPSVRVRQRPAWLGALGVAALYALVSGFGVPAQRALAATAACTVLRLSRVALDPVDIVAAVLLIVAVCQPLVVLTIGFQLSFGAVSLLAIQARWMQAQLPQPRGAARVVAAQLLMSVGLAPVSAAFFGTASLVGLPLNLVLIPVFACLIVPISLLAALLAGVWPEVAGVLFEFIAAALERGLAGLARVAAQPWAAVRPASAPVFVVALGSAGAVWAVLARGLPLHWLAVLAVCLPWLVRPPGPGADCAELTVLDVGHGLALLVRSHESTLLYDAGPAWPGGSAGQSVVAPWLRRYGVSRVSATVLSHPDSDHAGGLADLQRAGFVSSVLGMGERPCRAGQRWRMDGLVIQVLWPVPQAAPTDDNNRSCVLHVGWRGSAAALLTGDIETPAERELLALGFPGAPLVTVPHHGSATSSGAGFVAATAARVAWVSNARRRGWRMPHPVVEARWTAHGARLLQTAVSGTGRAKLCRAGGNWTLRTEH